MIKAENTADQAENPQNDGESNGAKGSFAVAHADHSHDTSTSNVRAARLTEKDTKTTTAEAAILSSTD